MPSMFSDAFNYIISLEHKEEPNYQYLKNLFKRQSSSIKIVSRFENANYNKKKLSLNMSNFLQVP